MWLNVVEGSRTGVGISGISDGGDGEQRCSSTLAQVQVAQELATVRADRDRLEAEKVELEVKWRNTGHERDAEVRKAAALRSQAESACDVHCRRCMW